MDRRNFIKNSLLVLGCSSIACGGKFLYDCDTKDVTLNGIKLTREQLNEQKYKNKKDLPKTIYLDACTLCQLNCPRCFMRLYPEKVKNGIGLGFLKFKDFKNLVDKNEFERISLSSNGEIFLNPELSKIIKYGFQKNINLDAMVGVNLNYLTNNMAETLVKYQFKQITVSIDGATPKTYAIYRRGGDFNTVIKNIEKINYYKKQYNSQFPKLTYKFILFGHNEHEIDQAKTLAKKLNMDMWFSPNYDRSYSPVKNIELVKEKTGVDASFSLYENKGEIYKNDPKEWFFCKELWTMPHINWDGKILGCCGLQASDFGGNAFKDGYMQALNHPKMIYARNMIANKAKPLDEIPCTSCYTYQAVKNLHLNIKPTDIRGNFWV